MKATLPSSKETMLGHIKIQSSYNTAPPTATRTDDIGNHRHHRCLTSATSIWLSSQACRSSTLPTYGSRDRKIVFRRTKFEERARKFGEIWSRLSLQVDMYSSQIAKKVIQNEGRNDFLRNNQFHSGVRKIYYNTEKGVKNVHTLLNHNSLDSIIP
mmetsp:Transcript_30859/g.47297  ORF Transcript_30859/g.47297 Transcript_30859/m.47297 type:complete len:156 (-) Transcript_30859:10-477(-)